MGRDPKPESLGYRPKTTLTRVKQERFMSHVVSLESDFITSELIPPLLTGVIVFEFEPRDAMPTISPVNKNKF